ncbi:hypothetical protein [Pantoea sp. A4]|uniref:hypothetical protein n=1 Tax=Pantoea sp. A4 TaxID=1225184 RepID=UPI00036D722D|nr:hypothetical protein [Pantoea sp. A4]
MPFAEALLFVHSAISFLMSGVLYGRYRYKGKDPSLSTVAVLITLILMGLIAFSGGLLWGHFHDSAAVNGILP